MRFFQSAAALTASLAAAAAVAGTPLSNQCIGCHEIPGYKTAFPQVYSVPKIFGQDAAYLAAALRAYKNGERSHPSMVAIAAQLSEEDIVKLADYYAGGDSE